MGGWIEISDTAQGPVRTGVPPRVGGWIEMHYGVTYEKSASNVPPRVGGWIEIVQALPL